MAPLSKSNIRRFYQEAAVTGQDAGDYLVILDERPLKTPGGSAATLPNLALAEAVASEWRAQAITIDLAAMPLTQLTFSAIDRGATLAASLADEVTRYAGADLLCYPAEHPASLAALQAERWEPWLAWASETLGVDLVGGGGIVAHPQAPDALERVATLAQAQGRYGLVALVRACGLFGSAVLAFALAHGALSGDAAHDLARLDEAWQEAHWGVDAEAAARTHARLTEARDLERWFVALVRGDE